MLQPRNFFHTVILDERLASSMSGLDNVLGILADNFYRRGLDSLECDLNPDDKRFHLEIYKTINPDGLEDGQGNEFYFGKGDVITPKGPDVRGLAPEWDGNTFDEVIYASRDAIVLTEDGDVLEYLADLRSSDWRTAVLILAAAGVEIVMPPMFVGYLNEELAEKIREKLATERQDYLAAITELGGAAVTRMATKDFGDIVLWASDLVGRKIWPKAVAFEAALRKQSKPILEQIRYRPLLKRIPSPSKPWIPPFRMDSSRCSRR